MRAWRRFWRLFRRRRGASYLSRLFACWEVKEGRLLEVLCISASASTNLWSAAERPLPHKCRQNIDLEQNAPSLTLIILDGELLKYVALRLGVDHRGVDDVA
jgi:hypothetical protein